MRSLGVRWTLERVIGERKEYMWGEQLADYPKSLRTVLFKDDSEILNMSNILYDQWWQKKTKQEKFEIFWVSYAPKNLGLIHGFVSQST